MGLKEYTLRRAGCWVLLYLILPNPAKQSQMQSLENILQKQTYIKNNNNVDNKYINNVDNVEKIKKVNKVNQIANILTLKLDDQKSFKFFCKVAWELPENEIWNNLESAMAGKYPARLFTWLCIKQMN